MLYNLLDQEVAPRLRFWSENLILSGQPLVFYSSTSFSPDSSKELTAVSRAIIRTGEFTPYANIILVAGAWGFDLD